MSGVDWDGLSGALVAAGTFVTTLGTGWAAMRAQRRPPGERARRRARRDLRKADRRLADAEAQVQACRVQREYAVRAVASVDAEEDADAARRVGTTAQLRGGVAGPWTDQVLAAPDAGGRPVGAPPPQ